MDANERYERESKAKGGSVPRLACTEAVATKWRVRALMSVKTL